MVSRILATAVAVAFCWVPAGGSADDALLPAVSSLPPSLNADWQEGLRLEIWGQYRESGEAYSRLFIRQPGLSEAAWRAARSFWQAGEEATLSAARDQSWPLFERAESLAAAGLNANPGCGECALWQFAAMGRLVEHRGTLWAAQHASALRDLLDLGIAAKPTHRDPNGNSALGNLYYSSAIFHRMVPEWFWLPLIVGVRGDTERALADIQRAREISGDRIDYQIEHGAILLCRSERKSDKQSARAGVEILERALTLSPRQPSDKIDQHFAKLMIAAPSEACNFTRTGFLDVEAMGREVR